MKSLVLIVLSVMAPTFAVAQAPSSPSEMPEGAAADAAEPSPPPPTAEPTAQPPAAQPPAATQQEQPADSQSPAAEPTAPDAAPADPHAADAAAPAKATAPAVTPPAASPTPAKAPEGGEQTPGEEMFAEKCASCHSIGKGDRVGPDLKDVHKRRGAAWLTKMIKTPGAMLGSDPDARALLKKFNGVRMPDLGLSDADTQTLVGIITRCSAEPCNLAGLFVAITEALPADAELGRQLFLGESPLKAGGPPCISCHTARGTGSIIAGGTLAKDLTHVFARLGDEGLDGALKNPPFALMKDIYADHKLEKEEVFALRAFFSSSNRSTDHSDSFSVVVVAAAGCGLCLIILNLFWRRRLRGVRKPMLGSQGVRS